MLKNDVINFINELDISEEKKESLLGQVETEGVTEKLIDELKDIISSMEQKIGKEHKGQVSELNAIFDSAAKELKKADKEFIEEMTAVNDEASKVSEQASKQIDQVNIDDIKQGLQD